MTNQPPDYVLDEQIGFLLRRAWQRHSTIFNEMIGADLTSQQFAALAKLAERGDQSQNQLGRLVAMDAATVKGVVARLAGRGYVETRVDPGDRRRLSVSLTPKGAELIAARLASARAISRETLAPLTGSERKSLLRLLAKIG
jgi:DNA-binding MarR family transcriptional regulator